MNGMLYLLLVIVSTKIDRVFSLGHTKSERSFLNLPDIEQNDTYSFDVIATKVNNTSPSKIKSYDVTLNGSENSGNVSIRNLDKFKMDVMIQEDNDTVKHLKANIQMDGHLSDDIHQIIKNVVAEELRQESYKTKKVKEWGEWSSWSLCSAVCGDGFQYRSRICSDSVDDTLCSGMSEESRKCYDHTFCNDLTHGETRKPIHQQEKEGTHTLIEKQTLETPKTVNPTTSTQTKEAVTNDTMVRTEQVVQSVERDPSSWSECSVTCGEGLQSRLILNDIGDVQHQTKACFMESCVAANRGKPQVVDEGNLVKLHCGLHEGSSQDIKWVDPDGEIITGDSRHRMSSYDLYIIHTTRADQGTYHCVVLDKKGNIVTADANLDVRSCKNQTVCSNHGMCIEVGYIDSQLYDHFVCKCDVGYIGKHCESGVLAISEDTQNVITIVGNILTLLALIMMAVACVFCVMKMKKQEQKKQEQENDKEQLIEKEAVGSCDDESSHESDTNASDPGGENKTQCSMIPVSPEKDKKGGSGIAQRIMKTRVSTLVRAEKPMTDRENVNDLNLTAADSGLTTYYSCFSELDNNSNILKKVENTDRTSQHGPEMSESNNNNNSEFYINNNENVDSQAVSSTFRTPSSHVKCDNKYVSQLNVSCFTPLQIKPSDNYLLDFDNNVNKNFSNNKQNCENGLAMDLNNQYMPGSTVKTFQKRVQKDMNLIDLESVDSYGFEDKTLFYKKQKPSKKLKSRVSDVGEIDLNDVNF